LSQLANLIEKLCPIAVDPTEEGLNIAYGPMRAGWRLRIFRQPRAWLSGRRAGVGRRARRGGRVRPIETWGAMAKAIKLDSSIGVMRLPS
jgi:hypothetical protein